MPHKILIWQVAPGAYLRPLPERRLTTQSGHGLIGVHPREATA
jgi:hypothetical protein